MESNRVWLLDVPVDPVTSDQAIDQLLRFLHTPGKYHVMTPNNEMLVEAHRNALFRSVLNQASLNLPDSTGLLWMARWTGQYIPQRVTGVDTVQKLCAQLGPDTKVFLLGGFAGIAERAAEMLKKMNPQLQVAGTFSGSPADEGAQEILQKINAAQPHLLLVAFGHPKQDLWIAKHLASVPSVGVAMGVGGTFDFLAGTQKRAPMMMRKLGLEWLWRLIREPKRWRRILTAVVVFPWLVLRYGKGAMNVKCTMKNEK